MCFRGPLREISLRCSAVLFFICSLVLYSPRTTSGQIPASWQAISKEELELKDNPQHPGDSAMILYREVQTDNAKFTETYYERIKIFNDQGKKYGDVEIPYLENEAHIEDIRARTVAPDGQATDFGGTVYDKVVARSGRVRLNVKAFTFPNVQAGSILEYSYSRHFHGDIPEVIRHPENYPGDAFPAARWAVQRRLYVRRAHFVLRPVSAHTHIEIRSVRLPKIAAPQQQKDGTLQMDVENVPGVIEEEYSPPEDTMRGEVYLYYVVGYFSNDKYWADLGQLKSEQMEKFFSKSKAIQEEALRTVGTSDTREATLRKLYDRVQQVRAVSFEPSKTEKEKERQNLKPNKTAEEVLTRNYAFANEINYLFVALAREAGFRAYPVRVTSRSRNFFLKSVPDPSQFDAEVVEVITPDKTFFLDPATLHCPFDLLPWEETDTQGIILDKFSYGVVRVPALTSADAVIERKAKFRLDKEGNLAGTLEVDFLGQEALVRRISENDKDEAGRKKDLEEEARNWLPQGATTKLTSAAGWDGSNGPLRAIFDVQAPNFATQAGDRLLLPVVAFHPRAEKAFQTSSRETPVYLKYGHQEHDELVLELPQGYKVESLPAPGVLQTKFSSYKLSTEQQGAGLKLTRNFVMDGYYFPVTQYPELRTFYNFVRANDEEQAILQSVPAN
jgi:Domain of Unknown Function with PDB structure (DUF3857)